MILEFALEFVALMTFRPCTCKNPGKVWNLSSLRSVAGLSTVKVAGVDLLWK